MLGNPPFQLVTIIRGEIKKAYSIYAYIALARKAHISKKKGKGDTDLLCLKVVEFLFFFFFLTLLTINTAAFFALWLQAMLRAPGLMQEAEGKAQSARSNLAGS